MSSDHGPRLRALIESWRTFENGNTRWDDGYESGLLHCADELDALLRASAQPTEQDGPRLRAQELLDKVVRIVDGFNCEAMNGIICTPPDGDWEAPPNRTWCLSCKARWARLRALPSQVDALLRASASAPSKHTAQCVEIGFMLGQAGFPEDEPIQNVVRQLLVERLIATTEPGASASALPAEGQTDCTETNIKENDDVTRSDTRGDSLVSSPPQPPTGLSEALREVILQAVTDSDSCAICMNDIMSHDEGCSILRAIAALDDALLAASALPPDQDYLMCEAHKGRTIAPFDCPACAHEALAELIADPAASALPEKEQLHAIEADVISHVVAHWITQGGEASFGDIGQPKNPDELVAAILAAARWGNPPVPSSRHGAAMKTAGLMIVMLWGILVVGYISDVVLGIPHGIGLIAIGGPYAIVCGAVLCSDWGLR